MVGHRECTPICPSYMTKIRYEEKPLTPRIRRAGCLKGKPVIRLVNHDMIRDLLVPSEFPNKYAAVFPKRQFEMIKEQAKHHTLEEKICLLKKEGEEKSKQIEECTKLRKQILDCDVTRYGVKPDAVDRSCMQALAQPNYALARAYELRQEQDDDIKRFNSEILKTKCHAIREAQIVEKKLIEKQLKEEEKRLDDMMEQERRKFLQALEDTRKNEDKKKQEYVKQLSSQMRDKEISKLLEAEHTEEESRRLQEANLQMQIEELENRKKQKALQEKIRKDLSDVNCQIKRFRELELEEEKIQEIKMKEFHRLKAEQESSRDLALKAQVLAHNQAFAKIWNQQKKEHDMRDKLNDIHEQRVQDEIERNWRQKEQQAARMRCELNEKLRKEREAQIIDTRRMKALQMAREKQEYDNVLRAQHDVARKEDERNQQKKKDSESYLRVLLDQMREKEQEKIREKQHGFEEVLSMRMEADCHEQQIKQIMHKKVEQLRGQKVPEKYVKQVECKINKPAKKSFTTTK